LAEDLFVEKLVILWIEACHIFGAYHLFEAPFLPQLLGLHLLACVEVHDGVELDDKLVVDVVDFLQGVLRLIFYQNGFFEVVQDGLDHVLVLDVRMDLAEHVLDHFLAHPHIESYNYCVKNDRKR
jgi:hypothetical protein